MAAGTRQDREAAAPLRRLACAAKKQVSPCRASNPSPADSCSYTDGHHSRQTAKLSGAKLSASPPAPAMPHGWCVGFHARSFRPSPSAARHAGEPADRGRAGRTLRIEADPSAAVHGKATHLLHSPLLHREVYILWRWTGPASRVTAGRWSGPAGRSCAAGSGGVAVCL